MLLDIVLIIMAIISAFVVSYAMLGYPLLLILLEKIIKPKEIVKDFDIEPTVTYMIVAHNEEKIIAQKLENAININYPKEKFQIIIASDNSTDTTNSVVQSFIDQHKEYEILLHCSKEHKGKTNAQNEAQKFAMGEILVMTDANTMLNSDSVQEIVASFVSDDIAYVCGKLVYSNAEDNFTSESESNYWNLELKMRDIESRITTITAGNGAIYACRNAEYIELSPIYCHDSMMPYIYSKQGKRAIFNPDAIAVEKAGETDADEFKRKVRMNRVILDMLVNGLKVLNIFKYKWFGLFYFGHRTCRYSLWWAHILFFIISCILWGRGFILFEILTIMQSIFILIALLSLKDKKSRGIVKMTGYYLMTVWAQVVGVFNILTGKSKPVWDKAESTR